MSQKTIPVVDDDGGESAFFLKPVDHAALPARVNELPAGRQSSGTERQP